MNYSIKESIKKNNSTANLTTLPLGAEKQFVGFIFVQLEYLQHTAQAFVYVFSSNGA